MLGNLASKFHGLVLVVENKDPDRLHARLQQTPSELSLQNSTRHTSLRWAPTDFFNDDFGRLTGTEPLFRGVRVAVIDPFFITCTDLQLLYDFPSVLIWQCMLPFDAPRSSDSLRVLLLRIFFQNSCVYSQYPII